MRTYFALMGALGLISGIGLIWILLGSMWPVRSRRQVALGLTQLVPGIIGVFLGLSYTIRSIRYKEIPIVFLDNWDRLTTIAGVTAFGLGVPFMLFMYLTYRRWPSDSE